MVCDETTSLAGLFNRHDIRGRWGEDLTLDRAGLILDASAEVIMGEEDTIVLGRDGRHSSPELHRLAVSVFSGRGINVIDLGACATEVVYFASGFFHLPGIMITASHNGAAWNGFKFCGPKAAPIGQDTGLWAIKTLACRAATAEGHTGEGQPIGEESAPPVATREAGIVSDGSEVAHTYAQAIRRIGRQMLTDNDLHIVVDGANGMANRIAPLVLEGLSVSWLAQEVDGSFPAHEPNPLKTKNIQALCEEVLAQDADLGLAYDGDGDRLVLVDESGQPLTPALAQSHLARIVLGHAQEEAKADAEVYALVGRDQPTSPDPVILYSEVSSQAVCDTIRTYGGRPVATPVGHSAIKAMMASEDALAAVEHSGHYYFKAMYGADSAMMATILVLNDLAHAKAAGQTFSQRLADLPVWAMAEEENWHHPDIDQLIPRITKDFQEEPTALMGGGLALTGEDWRITLRQSNTEPLIRLNVEAKRPERLSVIQEHIHRALQEAGALGEGHHHVA